MSGPKAKVLVMDPSVSVQRQVQHALSGSHVEVVSALDPFQAVGYLRSLRPKLVIADWQMCESRFQSFISEIPPDQEFPRFIVLRPPESALPNSESIDIVLDKPLDSESLAKAAIRLLEIEGAGPVSHSQLIVLEEETFSPSPVRSNALSPFQAMRAHSRASSLAESLVPQLPAWIEEEKGDLVNELPAVKTTEPRKVVQDLSVNPKQVEEEIFQKISDQLPSLVKEEVTKWLDREIAAKVESILKSEIEKRLASSA